MQEDGLPRLVVRREQRRDLAALAWAFPDPVLAISSAACGGGLGLRSWVVNAQVHSDYRRTDLDQHVGEIAAAAGLSGAGVGMLTAVDVRRHASASCDGVTVVATVGVTHPSWAAGRGGVTAEGVGTINLVCRVPARVSQAGLVNLVATATEAKCQALIEAGIAGTGTPSDAVTVCCPADGEEEPFGGPRSTWGSRLARAAHAAVAAGLATP